MFDKRPLVPGVTEGPLSSWEALMKYVWETEFTPDIDAAWRQWKKRSLKFLAVTLGFAAISLAGVVLLPKTPGYALALTYFIGVTISAVVSLPFVTWYKWALVKDEIEAWHREQNGEPEEPADEEPQEELRWLYIGDRKW